MTAPLPHDLNSSMACANFLARAILSSLQETLGDEFFASLLRESGLEDGAVRFPPDDVKVQFPLGKLRALFAVLEQMEGEIAWRGLLRRSGRAWFLNLQRRSSPSLGILTAQVLTLPKKLKVKRCGEILAEYFHRYIGFDFSVEPSQDKLEWRFEFPCLEQDFLLGNGLADLWFGFWSELLYTLSGGKPYLLELTSDAGENRPAWVIRIPYLPFEG